MKKIILLLAACAAVCSASAQQTSCIPDFIHLSGVARNVNGTPVTTFIDVKVELSQGDLNSGGVLKYCEQVQNIQPNNVGEFSMDFGNPTLICNPPAVLMSVVPWTTCNMWYRLSWRITGSPTYTQIASSQFSSIPYAFAARTAENVKGVSTAGAANGQVLKYDGTNFVPSTDNVGTAYTAGSGIAISGSTIKTNIAAQSVYYDLGMQSSTVYNSWQSNSNPIQITVNTPGKYLITATSRAFRSNGGSILSRVIDLNTNVLIGATVVLGSGAGAAQETSSFTKVQQFSTGQTLRMEFKADTGGGNWSFGGDSEGASSMSIIRLGD
jgi:hypothetical protein